MDELGNAKGPENVAVEIERVHNMQLLAVTQIECGELQLTLTVLQNTLCLAEKLNNPPYLFLCLLTCDDIMCNFSQGAGLGNASHYG